MLPGCRAWGATAEEALLNLEGVEVDFITACERHDVEIPAAIVGAGEFVIAV